MAIELSRLIKKVKHMDIVLLAGEKGLDNMVSWVHMVETKEASTFLEGGEIAFSTGIGLNNGLSLLELIKNMKKNNATGAIINVGPFIEHVSQEVIDFGNEKNFPIFMVPWKIHIAEIMRIFCFAITKSDQMNIEIAAAFKNAIFFPKQEELYLAPLSQNDFSLNWPYYVCVVNIKQSAHHSISLSRQESVCTLLENRLCHRHHINFAIFHYENQIVIVLGNYTEEKQAVFVKDLEECLTTFLQKKEEYYIGIGKCTKSIRCLDKSYHQAIAIQKLQEKKKISKSLNSYSHMGMYKLLMGIEDHEILSEYYEKTILPLIEYDQQNNSDLVDVLRCYLAHNGSVNETADALFVHRNTINYKLSKAAGLLNLNFSMLDTRLQLVLGFMLQDML